MKNIFSESQRHVTINEVRGTKSSLAPTQGYVGNVFIEMLNEV